MSSSVNSRDILRKIKLLSAETERTTREDIDDLFSNIHDMLVLEKFPNEDKSIHLQFRILEIKEILRFLSSLPFGTDDIQKTLEQHLSICLNNYNSAEQASLQALHLRVLDLPSISPDYFGFAVAHIKETIPYVPLAGDFEEIIPLLLPPSLLLRNQNPPYQTENILIVLEKVQQLYEVCKESPSRLMKSILPHLLSICCCYEDVINLIEKYPSSSIGVKAQLSGVGLGFFEIDMEVAHLLVNCTSTGVRRGKFISTRGGVFYKSNPQGGPYIQPEKEFAIYALYNLLEINGVAPVSLIKVQNVCFTDPSGNSKPYERIAQASLGVEGILLQDVIAMAEVPDFLRGSVGNQNYASLFDVLMHQRIDTGKPVAGTITFDLLEEMDIREKAKVLLSLYEQELCKLPPEKRCADFTTIPCSRNTLFEFCSLIDRTNTCRYILEALQVIKQYPEICVCSGRQCNVLELVELCQCMQKIKNLFPQLHNKDITLELDSMLSKFDEENFSAHFLVSVLTNPFDHKADNLMITLNQDEDGRIQKAKIVGIDNYLIFEGSRTKTVLYFLENMNHSFHNSIFKRLSQLTPEVFLLEWLLALEEQNNRYRRYIAQGVVTSSDFKDEYDISLNIPLQLDSSIVPNMYRKLKVLHDSQGYSHWDILSRAQPGISEAYQTVSNSSQQLQQALGMLPSPNLALSGYTETERLTSILESPAEAAQSFIRSIDISSLNEQTQVHLIGKAIGGFPSIEISMLGNDVNRGTIFLLAVEHGYCALAARLLEEQNLLALTSGEGRVNHSLLEHRDPSGKTPFLMACSHANTEMMKLLLSYGCDTLARDSQEKTSLILLIDLLKQNPTTSLEAIQFLIDECSNVPWNVGWGKSMQTPLHSLVDLYTEIPEIVFPLFSSFIGNASPDLMDHNGFSPLDYAMRQDLIEVVELFIKHGAGRSINVRLAGEFFQRHSRKDLYSELIQYPLMQLNFALEWLQTHSASSGVCLEVTQRGKIFLPPEIANTLFDHFNIRANSGYGRRNVANIKFGDDYELYFKQEPELPGIEYAVNLLFRILIGHGTSYTELGKVTHPSGKSYAVLISQAIRGENFHDVLTNKPQLLQKLNEQRFSELFLASLLVNFEDAKPDNFILEQLSDGSYQLVGIDNDHAFFPVVSKDEQILLKNILYCMDNMKLPIHPKAREKFLSFSPERILRLWLEKLVMKQEETSALFPDGMNGNKNEKTFTGILLRKGTIIDIYQKFKRIQNCLRESESVTGMDLLYNVIPELGIRYEQPFRNQFGPKRHFLVPQFSGKFTTIIYSNEFLEINLSSAPTIAIQELETFQIENQATNKMLIEIQGELEKGNISAFQNLRFAFEKENIINGIANEFPPFNFSIIDHLWSGINESRQKTKFIESVLCCGQYHSLHIHRYTFAQKDSAFQSSLLKQIGQSSPHLVSLELVNCKGLDAKMIQGLSGLKYLNSLRLAELRDLNGVVAVSCRLRSLEISHCQGIVELKIPNSLRRLVVSHCLNLTSTTAHYLVDLKLLEEDNTFRLEKLTMRACIKHPLWKIFPNYLRYDCNHYLHFENIPLRDFEFDHFFDNVSSDIMRYPKAFLAQDLCAYYNVSFHEFSKKILDGYQGKKGQVVRDYATALNLVLQLGDSPELDLTNQLTGEIPPEIVQFSTLESLNLGSNDINDLPRELFQLVNLTSLDLNNNQLVEIPRRLAELALLKSFSAKDNLLTGIPCELAQLTNLTELYLNSNQLTGEIPSILWQISKLSHLHLNNNQLTGEIPKELTRLSYLKSLRLDNNQITGPIPPELSQLSQLSDLRLNNNQLSGQIPLQLSRLSQLSQLWLNNNLLTGNIPPQLSQLSLLSSLYLDNNQLTGVIPPSLFELTELSQLYLNNNQLEDEISPDIEDAMLFEKLRAYLDTHPQIQVISPELAQLTNSVFSQMETNREENYISMLRSVVIFHGSPFPFFVKILEITNTTIHQLPEKSQKNRSFIMWYYKAYHKTGVHITMVPRLSSNQENTAEQVKNYYELILRGISEAKRGNIFIVGQEGVGKTSMVKNILGEAWSGSAVRHKDSNENLTTSKKKTKETKRYNVTDGVDGING